MVMDTDTTCIKRARRSIRDRGWHTPMKSPTHNPCPPYRLLLGSKHVSLPSRTPRVSMPRGTDFSPAVDTSTVSPGHRLIRVCSVPQSELLRTYNRCLVAQAML